MTQETIIVRLARNAKEQVSHLKGKKRDEAVINFWAGAIAGLFAVGHEDAGWVQHVGWMLVATRGYAEIETILKQAELPVQVGA